MASKPGQKGWTASWLMLAALVSVGAAHGQPGNAEPTPPAEASGQQGADAANAAAETLPAVPPQEAVLPQSAPSGPAAPGETTVAPQAELAEIETFITLNQERVDTLRREIQAMGTDRAQQSAALVAAAQRVNQAEAEVGAMQERLQNLSSAERQAREQLEGVNANVGDLLSALQRISRNPPPVLIVHPSDALGSARSAALLASVLPQLRARAETVTGDLARLRDIRAAAVDEEIALRANLQILEEEQLRIATLIEARKRGATLVGADLQAEEQEAEALFTRAKALRERVAALNERASAIANASRGQPGPSLTQEQIAVALANIERTEPAFLFEQARGHLFQPANGVVLSEFGASDGLGGIAEGVSIATNADAQVVAPADGWVIYRGPYLNYGQIVIINPGQGYTILLAGLESVAVDLGQFVLMGEPVGLMGSRTMAHTVSTSAGASRPTLYMELRENNVPIDPSVWWATQDNRTQSG